MNAARGRRPKNACGSKLRRSPSKCWHVEDYDITMQMIIVGNFKTNILVRLLLLWINDEITFILNLAQFS